MKNTVTSLFALALVGAASFIGCGDDTNNNPTGGNTGATIALDDLGTKTAEAFCEQVYTCCTTAEQDKVFEGLMPKPANEAECVTTFKAFYDMQVLPDVKAAVEAGRVEYDGELAATCSGKLDCSSLGAAPDPECEAVFVGKVADGSDCGGDDECSGADSVCVGEGQMMLGKCQPRGGVDTACDFSNDCSAGNYCDFATNKCAAQVALGEMCSGSGSCKDSFCDFMAGTCIALKDDGAACDFSDECKNGICDPAVKMCGTPAPVCDGM